MVLLKNVENLDQRHAIPTDCATSMKGGSVRRGIGPRLCDTFVISVPEQPRCRIIQVLVVNQQLPSHFIICICAIAKHLSVAREKRERHENSISPQLPLPVRVGRM